MKRSAASLNFEQRWSSLRKGEDLIPRRLDLRPVAFKEHLPATVIIGIDPLARTMPVKLAGTALREFVGFELTGHDFIEFDNNAATEQDWPLRLAYHDHPVGRYDEVLVNFDSRLKVECAITALPLWGRDKARLIIALVEPREAHAPHYETRSAVLTDRPNKTFYLDIGAGIPEFSRDDTR